MTVPPKGQVALLHFGAQRRGGEEGVLIAFQLENLGGEALAGMSREELAQVQSFNVKAVLPPPTLTLQTAAAKAGTTIAFNGSHFSPGVSVPITFGGRTVAEALPDDSGEIAGVFVVPDLERGEYSVVVLETLFERG